MRLRRPRRPAATVSPGVALLAIALLTSCSAAAPAGPLEGLPHGVTVALVQLRSDVAAGQAQVEVRNAGEDTLEIGAVAVSDPRFADDATRVVEKTTRVPPGVTVNIRIQLPAMSCDQADGTSTVALTFLDGDSEVVRTAPLPDTLDFVRPLHEQECRARAMADAATVTFGSFEPSPPGVPADLALEVVPTGGGEARIVAIQTTNLLSFEGVGSRSFPIDLPVTPADTAPVAVHLPLVPLRCDPHAVQEDKRGTVFSLEVEFRGETGLIRVAADEDMRARILDWVADWCGFGPG